MTNVRYITADNSIVAWITDSGWECSAPITAFEVCEYLNSGGVIAPYAPPVVDPKEQARADLAATDKEMARIAEDLINVLILKGLMTIDDLPRPVIAKLNDRANLRKVLQADDD